MKTILFATALAALVIPVSAQDTGRQDRRPPPPPGGPLCQALDTDDDHVIDAEEIAKATESLRALDTDGDGTITRAEAKLPPPPPKPEADESGSEGGAYDQPPAEESEDRRPPHPPGPPTPPLFAVLDTDRDGTISADELAAAPESLKKLDKNKDGKLTPEELHPHARPPGPPPERRPRPERDGRRR